MNPSLRHFAALACVAFAFGTAAPVALAQTSPKIIKKVPPEFPREAARKGVDKGVLKAKLTVDGNGVPTAVEIARTIASKSPVSTRMGKHTLNVIEDMSLRDGYRYEQDMTAQIGKTADAQEAQRAFREKRPPVFTGR